MNYFTRNVPRLEEADELASLINEFASHLHVSSDDRDQIVLDYARTLFAVAALRSGESDPKIERRMEGRV